MNIYNVHREKYISVELSTPLSAVKEKYVFPDHRTPPLFLMALTFDAGHLPNLFSQRIQRSKATCHSSVDKSGCRAGNGGTVLLGDNRGRRFADRLILKGFRRRHSQNGRRGHLATAQRQTRPTSFGRNWYIFPVPFSVRE